DNVLTTLLSVAMPSWLALFIDLFLLSAVVSSADSCLFAASSTLSRSLLKTDNIKTNRWCTIILILLALLLTFSNKGILAYLLMANNVYVCSIVIPVIMCFLFRQTVSTLSQPIMLTGMLLAGGCGLFSAFTDKHYVAYL